MKRFTSTLLHLLETLTAMGLLMIAATVVLQVILSSCFNSSITGANEIITKLFVYTTAVGSAIAVGKREHIAITFATESMPPWLAKLTEWLGLTLVAILNLVVVAYSFHWISVTGEYLMPTTQLPRYFVQVAIPIGSFLAAAFCILRLVSGEVRSEPVVQNDTSEPQS